MSTHEINSRLSQDIEVLRSAILESFKMSQCGKEGDTGNNDDDDENDDDDDSIVAFLVRHVDGLECIRKVVSTSDPTDPIVFAALVESCLKIPFGGQAMGVFECILRFMEKPASSSSTRSQRPSAWAAVVVENCRPKLCPLGGQAQQGLFPKISKPLERQLPDAISWRLRFRES
jgi:hypothetical protein